MGARKAAYKRCCYQLRFRSLFSVSSSSTRRGLKSSIAVVHRFQLLRWCSSKGKICSRESTFDETAHYSSLNLTTREPRYLRICRRTSLFEGSVSFISLKSLSTTWEKDKKWTFNRFCWNCWTNFDDHGSWMVIMSICFILNISNFHFLL